MNDIPVWTQIVIAVVGGGTVGGLAGAFSPLLSSRLTYQQKLDEDFRANVHLHIETVYIPLNIALSKLADRLDQYWGAYYITGEKGNEEAFIREVIEFTKQISELFKQGKDVYLTGKLVSHLRSLNKFIDLSMGAHMVQRRAKLPPIFYFAFSSVVYISHPKIKDDRHMPWKYYIREAKKILFAPIGSLEFKIRLEYEIDTIKSLIREVTLGTIPLA